MYIELEDVSKEYGAVWAMDRANMAIDRQEFVALLGPSGSGKTTLLRMIAGLERPTRGRVRIDGQDVTDLPPHKRGVAMVFQEFLLFPHRTVAENLAFPLRMAGLARDEIQARVRWTLDLMSLAGLEDRYPNQLSGGQQQRVALGRGLICKPKVLLLDEPLANLDRELRQEMEVEIRRHQIALGIPFIYVTHNQEEALSMSDRIAVIRAGRIEDFAERQAVYERPRTAFIAQFVGRSNRFAGRITEDGRCLETDEGTLLELPAEGTSFQPGSNVEAFIKTERLRLHQGSPPGTQGVNRLQAKVRDVILRGPMNEYLLTTATGRDLSAARPRDEPLLPRESEVTVDWQADDIDAFAIEASQGSAPARARAA